MKMNKGGHPRTFKNGDDILYAWKKYCNEIADSGYSTTPTQTSFARWLEQELGEECDRRTIWASINKYYPEIKKEFEQVRGETVAEGAMLGKYQPTMSIFALKNWCGWKDQKSVDMDVAADAKVHFCFERLPNGTSEDELMG